MILRFRRRLRQWWRKLTLPCADYEAVKVSVPGVFGGSHTETFMHRTKVYTRTELRARRVADLRARLARPPRMDTARGTNSTGVC